MLLLHVGNIIFGKVLSRAKARYKMQRQWRERSFVLIIDPIDSIINKHRLTQLEINWYFLMDPTPDVKSITNKHCSCLSFSTECIGNAKWNSISRWLLLYIYIVIYILYISCSMFFFRKIDIPTIQYCKICVHENESKLAATWCPECEDFLCTNCSMHHSRSSSSKQHIVISIENYQKLPSHIRGYKKC
jgi:hypothetical protein